MMYRLIVLTGPRKGERITVDQEPMALGRDPDCEIPLDDDEVTAKHAMLEHKQEGLYIRDLGSMNKILVNHREFRESRLKHGDMVEIGRTRFLVQAVVQADVQNAEEQAACVAGMRWLRRSAMAVVVLAAAWYILRPSGEPAVPDLPPAPVAIQAGAPAPVAATVPTPPVATPSDPPVTQEIQRMRQDLQALRQSMQELARAPTPPTLPEAVPAPATPEMPQAERQLEEAQDAIAKEDFDLADRLLATLQRQEPDYLPAYEERALLFEKRGQPGRAQEQWAQILRRSTESPLYQRAVNERVRLGHSDHPPVQPGTKVLRVAGVEQTRFPATDEFDDMRLVNVNLQVAEGGAEVISEGVRVEVTFFDEDQRTGNIDLSKSVEPPRPITVDGEILPDRPARLSASYLVPHGARERVQETLGRDDHYYGYVVRVYYFDTFQDESASPKSLLTRVAPAEVAVGARTALQPADSL